MFDRAHEVRPNALWLRCHFIDRVLSQQHLDQKFHLFGTQTKSKLLEAARGIYIAWGMPAGSAAMGKDDQVSCCVRHGRETTKPFGPDADVLRLHHVGTFFLKVYHNFMSVAPEPRFQPRYQSQPAPRRSCVVLVRFDFPRAFSATRGGQQ